jgi:hypothetical protein
MVWGGISVSGKTDLYIFLYRHLGSTMYCREVVDVHVRPYAGAVGPDFILMQDNAHPYTAHLIFQYLARENNRALALARKFPRP